jgi:hypothetical protein
MDKYQKRHYFEVFQGLLAIFLLLCGFVFYIWLRIEAENDCNGIVVRGSTGAMTACVENVR